jgi:hypothetical protein
MSLLYKYCGFGAKLFEAGTPHCILARCDYFKIGKTLVIFWSLFTLLSLTIVDIALSKENI